MMMWSKSKKNSNFWKISTVQVEKTLFVRVVLKKVDHLKKILKQ